MYRSIDTEVWNDGWFQEELNRDQKLLFLFLITNQRTTTAGAFEITLSSLSTETGIPRDELNDLLASLAPKVMWWPEHRIVWVRNFHRRQFPNANEKIVTNARSVLDRMPEEVRDTVCREYPSLGYPTDRVSIPLPIEEKEKSRDTETDTADQEQQQEEDVPRSRAATSPPDVDDGSVDLVIETLIAASFVNDDEAGVRRGVLRSYQLVPDFSTRDGPFEAAQFVAHYTTGKGKKSPPSDWTAAFRNWLKNAVKYERRDAAGNAGNERSAASGAGAKREPVARSTGQEGVTRRGYSYNRAVGLEAAG